jgi:hypothetical protein
VDLLLDQLAEEDGSSILEQQREDTQTEAGATRRQQVLQLLRRRASFLPSIPGEKMRPR